VPAADVERVVRSAGGDLLAEVELFDVYRGAGVDDGRRSLAYRLRFQALDHTLTDAEIADVRRRCVQAVESEHLAHLRG
jgi:phenylalanyl-tRNA synthetase beta chain